MKKRFVLVAGATGLQGGAVAYELMKIGHRVRALTRRPDSEASKQLGKMGAEVIAGDFNDPDSLVVAAKGVDAVFAMAVPFPGADDEIRFGKALAEAALRADVSHFVYSSVANADQKTNIPHFDSKYEIEEYIKELRLPWTVVAPVFFMENLLRPWIIKDLKRGVLHLPLPPERKLKLISVQDIGRFTATAIEQRELFLGRRIDIAADDLSGREMADIMSGSAGRKVRYEEQRLEDMRSQSSDWVIMYKWFDETGYSVDIDGLQWEFPEVGWTSFDRWVKAQDWTSMKHAA